MFKGTFNLTRVVVLNHSHNALGKNDNGKSNLGIILHKSSHNFIEILCLQNEKKKNQGEEKLNRFWRHVLLGS